MIYLRPLHVVVLAAVTALMLAACSDHCTDVACAPAPPPLTVIVNDTVTIDTTVLVSYTNPVRVDTVDTTLVKVRAISDAEVILQRVIGADTVTFDTVRPQGAGSVEFTLLTVDNLPDTTFQVRATRGTRTAVRSGLKLEQVEGCCPYPVVGRYALQLPSVP
jgi:hypothetical protein